MLAEQRRQSILELLKRNGSVRTSDLALHFKVSDQTIRRDFWDLEERGLISKGHGGAVLANYSTVPYRDRAVLRRSEKLAIAREALRLVRPGMTLALGPGTTTEALAHLVNGMELELITNSLAVAQAVSDPATRVHLLGGRYRPSSELVTGEQTIQNLESRFADIAFTGVSGIDENDGYTVTEEDEARVIRQCIRIAKTAVMLSDSSKFSRIGKARVAPLSAVHLLITDSDIAPDDRRGLEAQGVQVVIARSKSQMEGGGGDGASS